MGRVCESAPPAAGINHKEAGESTTGRMMKKWHVTGKRMESGEQVSLLFHANDYEHLKSQLREHKILMSNFEEVSAESASMPSLPPTKLEEAYGLTRTMSGWAIALGLLLAPMLLGIPLAVWGIVAICKMNREALYRGERSPGIASTPLTEKRG